MSRVNEYKDSTVDGAIQKGLADMGLSLDKVEVTVIKNGGLFSKACVSIAEKEVEEVIAEAVIAEEVEEEVIAEAPVVAEAPVKEASKKPAKKKEQRILTEEELAIVAEVAEKSSVFISTIMAHVNPTATVTHKIVDGEICIDIEGEEAGKVIGYRGETLEALQYLTLVCCNRQEQSFVRYNIDANGYRRKRRETLTSLAHKLARKAAKSGQVVELEPMSPLERRIIHTALMEDTFVKTESAGEGKLRHVKIVPNRQGGGNNRGRDRYDRNKNNNRRGNRPAYNNDQPREYVNKYDEIDPIYVPKEFVEEVVEENTSFGTTSDFRKKGAGKTRSFGAKAKRF